MLSANSIGAPFCAELCHALAANKALTSLGLSHNHVGVEGCVSLLQGLGKN